MVPDRFTPMTLVHLAVVLLLGFVAVAVVAATLDEYLARGPMGEARIRWAEGEVGAAQAAAEKALGRKDGYLAPQVLVATALTDRTLEMADLRDEAASHWKELEGIQGLRGRAQVGLGILRWREGTPEGREAAAALFEAATVSDPALGDAWIHHATAAIEAGDHAAARSAYETAISKGEVSIGAQVLLHLGIAAIDRETDLSRADRHVRAAAWQDLRWFRSNQAHPAAARRRFSESFRIEAEATALVRAWDGRRYARVSSGLNGLKGTEPWASRFRCSIASMLAAVSLRNAIVVSPPAEVAGWTRNTEEHLRIAASNGADPLAGYHVVRGLLLYRQSLVASGQPAERIRAAAAALGRATACPDWNGYPETLRARVRATRGVLLAESGDAEGAAVELRRSLELAPDAAVSRDLGIVLERSGDRPGAADAYRRSLGMDADQPDLRAHLAAWDGGEGTE